MATLTNTTINDTAFLRVPVGTTAERPASPQLAMMRFNSQLTQLEIYNGTEWRRLAGGASLTGSGGSVTNSGGFRIHSFTSSGTFTIS